MKNAKKRDPLKKEPLRQAGQSTTEQRDRFFGDRIEPWGVVLCFSIVFAALEWYRWAFNVGVNPILMTLLCTVTAILAIIRVIQLRKNLDSYDKGARGEKRIGELLDRELLPRGYHVYHDICIDDHNIDHALIGPTGAFAIETKAISKPMRGRTEVTFAGDTMLFNGTPLDRDPIVQARAVAKDFRELIRDSSGQYISVQPVVIPVGWYVHEQMNNTDVRVFMEERFFSYMRREPIRFDEQTIRFLTANLERVLRDQESKGRVG